MAWRSLNNYEIYLGHYGCNVIHVNYKYSVLCVLILYVILKSVFDLQNCKAYTKNI